MFLVFIAQLYQYFSLFFLFALLSDEPEVFLPKYSQTAILHAVHFWRVVNAPETRKEAEVGSPFESGRPSTHRAILVVAAVSKALFVALWSFWLLWLEPSGLAGGQPLRRVSTTKSFPP